VVAKIATLITVGSPLRFCSNQAFSVAVNLACTLAYLGSFPPTRYKLLPVSQKSVRGAVHEVECSGTYHHARAS
jgi:hypothetical protein